MRRIPTGVVRPGWREIIAGQGLVYNDTALPTGGAVSYWREGPFYDLTSAEVDSLHADAETLFEMCVAAGDHMLDERLLGRLGIPEFAWDQIARTWYDDETEPGGRSRGDFSPSVYGRFDLRYAGTDGTRPRLLEFNADTPTALPESAVIQWYWHQQTAQGKDQWNALHERLIAAWQRNIGRLRQARPALPDPLTIHFACDDADDSGEDVFNTEYLMETARQALGPTGCRVKFLWMSQIGAGDIAAGDHFYDADGERIHVIFKLYPWEWMTDERFARQCFRDMGDPLRDGTVWIEPPYKMLWSNKGLLPVLWKLYGDDPARRDLLLPAYFEEERPAWLTSYVRKPLLGREGANVSIVVDGVPVLSTPGPYGDGPFVCQAYAPLPGFPDEQGVPWHPVLGLWLVDGEPAGLGIRESAGLVTDNLSHFVPHTIDHTG
ncbi:glutathionylspermidine synthase family protein [Dactylosporangium roseum]|uniref:Glutathionylspermidine synthase family protein n=1 Tax=Dactylosporangium roseum TaxID=47989 RepID=A0ABY5Z672_9ACTN|nr:glutathionylspermidine synthase family protein [Dactylosporangium roseum]UWZ36553.1 glutathionylspermidine synthase family protein [Dactylosporangium roseum]